MPLLDSFKVDHTKMRAPGVRMAKTMSTPRGDDITVFDLRFCIPNEGILPERGIHTLEHLFAGFMREHLNSEEVEVIDISPMGCRTGFYMSVIGTPHEEVVARAWESSMNDVLRVKEQKDIPELNIYQCGTYEMHSLAEAKSIAMKVIEEGIVVMNNDNLTLDESLLNEIAEPEAEKIY